MDNAGSALTLHKFDFGICAPYGWLLHTLSKLGRNGVGAVLLVNGTMFSGGVEYEIRKRMIENDVVESIIVLPQNMFYTTNISAAIGILNKNKKSRIEKRPDGDVAFRDRSDKILFMDLRQMGTSLREGKIYGVHRGRPHDHRGPV